jgi:hypothetical protein
MPQQDLAIPVDKAERLDFLLDIYPSGIGYSQLLDNVKKYYKTNDIKAKEKSDKLLNEMDKDGWITIKLHKGGSKSILISKKGFETISAYMRRLKTSNTRKYFARLKTWMIAGHNDARISYQRSAMEVFLSAPEIACMLVTPHLEVNLVEYYARITGKPADDDTRAFVMDYVGMLVGLGFAKMNEVDNDGNKMVTYYLLKEGRAVMEMMFKTMSSNGVVIAARSQKQAKPTTPWTTWISLFGSFIIIIMIVSSVSSSLYMDTYSATAAMIIGFLATLLPITITFVITKLGLLIRRLKTLKK